MMISFNPNCLLGRSPSINSEGQRPSEKEKSNKPCKGEIYVFRITPLQGLRLGNRVRRALPYAIDERASP